ncbi:hypothetical protein COX85_00555 [Candidatus Micrarchaeota archaeon CG_4_10_14_0_2_um_filter_55_9]|nr:MAG: hypothetical protein AUJ15_03335 [Candidatus Micrarchaeota archaeon CG1_02_55_41]PIO03011.1 MAG: hypothetical protein COT57_01255 [Candidatus Micrarchaeota archaeon CG09_land_8_20_14_0_10_55_25]PIZ92049.1 MAG: hypothetical protein COX85_00555 [Candidatus Micrarchaeota archaeon CG_4_10_14_0_2_um_filter_55_9]PJD01434.1 MAG: hypothetical protein COU38_01075 [Candidatus Micrarchaeota archaeon CG10_big_fil_rev_8_21_14_0_10_54_18]
MKAQISVEFFLLASFTAVLTILIYQSNAALYSSTKQLDDAYLTRNSLTRLAEAVDRVWLEGNASKMSFPLFFPSIANCFYFTGSELYCVMPTEYAEPPNNALKVGFNAPLFVDCPQPMSAGWSFVVVENNSTHAVVTC